MEFRTQKEGVEVRIDVQPDLPRAPLQAEPMQQVIINLFSNALDAVAESDTKRVDIRLAVRDDRFELQVGDTGSGMTIAQQAEIFDPFYTTKPRAKAPGSGCPSAGPLFRTTAARSIAPAGRGWARP